MLSFNDHEAPASMLRMHINDTISSKTTEESIGEIQMNFRNCIPVQISGQFEIFETSLRRGKNHEYKHRIGVLQ